MILTDKEEKNSEMKHFIEDLKENLDISSYIVFDKKDITLKIDIDEVQLKIPKQEFYSKVNAKINAKTKDSEDIIKMLNKIPNYLELRLEADYIEQIIELMRSKVLIEKMKEHGIKFLYKGIEIEQRIFESKMDEDDFKNEVKEIEAKRDRLGMNCDK